MKKMLLTCNLSLAFFAPVVEAKEILGLNFCETVSVNDIKKSLEKNEATVDEEKTNDDTGEITISTKDYKVADSLNEVNFNIYKGKLYKIIFKDGNKIDGILKAKYGLLKHENLNDGIKIEDIFYYNSKDKNIDIFHTYGKLSPSLGLSYQSWNTMTYLCKPIARLLKSDIERIENKKQLQKKGSNQL